VNQNSSDTVPYVDTAKTSQMSGLRNCGHRPIVLGYGNSQYAASHGRPVCSSGNSAAHATANSVIASANRLIDVRHCCRKSSRIAEISVPAWPMPIHQTKLMIGNAQPTGMLLPKMPMPVVSRWRIVKLSSSRSRNAMPKPTNHPVGVRFSVTMSLIRSVTVSTVCPGSRTG
jgi:hypothetical protein